MPSIRKQILDPIVALAKLNSSLAVVRRTVPTIKEIGQFREADLPAVAVTDRGYAVDIIRAGNVSHVMRKDFTLSVDVSVYVLYNEASDDLLSDIVEDLESRFEADQTLGVTVTEGLWIKRVSCSSAIRAPFHPVNVEIINVQVEYTIYYEEPANP